MKKAQLTNDEQKAVYNVLQVMKYVQCPQKRKEAPLGMEMIDTVLGTDGLVGRFNNTYLALCFAGSNEPMDWFINIAKAVNEKGVHEGFFKATKVAQYRVQRKLLGFYEDSEEQNTARLKKAAEKLGNEPIYVGGYSNGAAIATIFAAGLADLGFNSKLVTWGQPKVANTIHYANKVRNYVRFSHPLDPVVYVPLKLLHQNAATHAHTYGFDWFTHSFNQYAEQTEKLYLWSTDKYGNFRDQGLT